MMLMLLSQGPQFQSHCPRLPYCWKQKAYRQGFPAWFVGQEILMLSWKVPASSDHFFFF